MTGVKTVVPLVLHNQLTIPIHGLKPVAKITIVPLALLIVYQSKRNEHKRYFGLREKRTNFQKPRSINLNRIGKIVPAARSLF